MSLTIPTRRTVDLEYPDSDGLPMSDNTLQFKWIVTVKEGLEAQYRNDPEVFVAGDLLWYPQFGKPKVRRARHHGRFRPSQGLSGILQAVGRSGYCTPGRV